VEVAKAVDRQFVVQARAAHLLVSLSQDTRIQVPDIMRDPDLLVYDRRFHRQETWEKNLFAQLGDRVVTSDYVREHQDELVVQLDFTTMPELIDIQPVPGSAFIHSKSEPIEENDEVEKAVANWVRFFKLRRSQYHASGHMSEREIADMIRAIAPKAVIPIHTEYPGRFTQFASHVVQPVLASPMPVG
jgi:mRNA degradation ribonuclease J1/J2